MARVSVTTTTTTLSAAHPLAANELAHACGAGIEWVVQLVEVGIVSVPSRSEPPDDWRFQSADLQQALAARRLERDFGVDLDAAALILDLEHELRRAKALLRSHGIEPGP